MSEKNFGESYKDYYEEGKEREKEQREELILSDKFWDTLQRKIRVPLPKQTGNPEYLQIIFNSQHPDFKEDAEELIKSGEFKEDEIYIHAKYFLDEGAIHLNLPREDIEENEDFDLTEVICHELVHYIQDLIKKYPKMGKSKNLEGKEPPWEKEAYKLQEDKDIKKIFEEECEFIEN